jgi:hypothetical protein
MKFPVGRSVRMKPGSFIDELGFIRPNQEYCIIAVNGERIQLLGYPNPSFWFESSWFERIP